MHTPSTYCLLAEVGLKEGLERVGSGSTDQLKEGILYSVDEHHKTNRERWAKRTRAWHQWQDSDALGPKR